MERHIFSFQIGNEHFQFDPHSCFPCFATIVWWSFKRRSWKLCPWDKKSWPVGFPLPGPWSWAACRHISQFPCCVFSMSSVHCWCFAYQELCAEWWDSGLYEITEIIHIQKCWYCWVLKWTKSFRPGGECSDSKLFEKCNPGVSLFLCKVTNNTITSLSSVIHSAPLNLHQNRWQWLQVFLSFFFKVKRKIYLSPKSSCMKDALNLADLWKDTSASVLQ